MNEDAGKVKREDADLSPQAKDQALLEALEQAAAAIGVVVRYDKLATGDVKSTSGSCRIRGVDTIIIDRRLGAKERISALARELSQFNLENVFLPPAARELIEPSDNGGERRKRT